jgi:crotonobetainyl-CoA:carnitine CoA-transferase CaiB-like acyl-CoA transferase
VVGPLDGYRILDLTQVVSGPLATMLLADQGADVIKVEPVEVGDSIRTLGFQSNGLSSGFANLNRGKRSVAVDLSTDEGRTAVLGLARHADVFVENFRPGVMERLGLDYDHVRSVQPAIVYVSITGFGDDGPYAGQPVFDPVIQGLTGMVSRQVNPQIPFPDLVRNIVADKATALTAAQAITAALLVREKGGGGQRVSVPMLDSTLYFFWPDGMMDHTWLVEGLVGVTLAEVYSLTPTADGHIVYFAATTAQRQGLYRALGRPEWGEDERFLLQGLRQNDPSIRAMVGGLLAEIFETIPTAELLERLHAEDVPCGPISALGEVHLDPQVIHNRSLFEWEHPTGGRLRQPRPGARFSGTPVELRFNVPGLGEHTDEVLGELRSS